MKIKTRNPLSIGTMTLFLELISKSILKSEKREEMKYWLEYHANRLGILKTENKQ